MTLNAEKDTGPKTLDPAELGMHLLASGVRVSSVGEDGDVLLMGHHDDQTALALFAEFQRYENGETLTEDDLEVYVVERRYAAFSDHSEACDLVDCTCDDRACKPCRSGDHGGCDEPEHCECKDDDHEVEGPWPCSCECYCDDYAWWVSDTRSGHEATWIRYSFDKFKARRALHETTPLPPVGSDAPGGAA